MPRRKKAFDGLSITDAELMATALIGLERQRDEIEEKMAELRRQIEARPGRRPGVAAIAQAQGTPVAKKRTRSAAVRRRMAEAQRKRWAALKRGAAEEPQPVKRRKISAAARRRMSEGSKKRWARFRAK